MPAGHPPISAHPGKPFRTLSDAARDGQLICLRCNLCRRTIHFLASDLANFVGPKHPVHIAPLTCSNCKTKEFVGVTVRSPQPGDYGRLPVR